MWNDRASELILGNRIEVATVHSTAQRLITRAELNRPGYVSFATAYMLVKAARDVVIGRAYGQADYIVPDGTPVAWCLRLLGHPRAQCISGPRLMPELLRLAAARGIAVGFYGGRQATLDRMGANLLGVLPNLKIAYRFSPPFRELTEAEDQQIVEQILASGTQMLFIGLGSPKQDLWMHDHRQLLPCVTLGVGAAFEFLSGEKYLPPFWVQRLGLTWLVRLCQEPRRLLRRNLYSPVFVVLFLLQWVFKVRFDSPVASPLVEETFGD